MLYLVIFGLMLMMFIFCVVLLYPASSVERCISVVRRTKRSRLSIAISIADPQTTLMWTNPVPRTSFIFARSFWKSKQCNLHPNFTPWVRCPR